MEEYWTQRKVMLKNQANSAEFIYVKIIWIRYQISSESTKIKLKITNFGHVFDNDPHRIYQSLYYNSNQR